MHRINAIAAHFCSTPSSSPVSILQRYLVHDNHELRESITDFLKDDIYRQNYELSLSEYRELTLRRIRKFIEARFFSVRDYVENPRKFMAVMEMISLADFSMGIKTGVHFTLCGGSICRLGTKKHHDAYLDKMDSFELPGSYCMTELGHGSNVAGLETTATYDSATREFIIHTPSNTASKFWIGGAGLHGKITVVFAQLSVSGVSKGVHAFVMRIRDDKMRPMPGVTIKDIGHKMGLNGIDNGQLWFNQVRISRDALLDRFCSIDDAGGYHSPISNDAQRFGMMIGGLTTGRMLIAQGCIDAMKLGLCIAIRFGADRPQFGEKRVLEYSSYQRAIIPSLADAYALHIAMGNLKEIVTGPLDEPLKTKVVHIVSSGLKAAASWTAIKVLQRCRECCGGLGYHSSNKIPELIADTNITATFEGSNPVLMQQVARALMEQYRDNTGFADNNASVPLSLSPKHLLYLMNQRENKLVHTALAAQSAKKLRDMALVEIGWANVEKLCMTWLIKASKRAPPEARGLLDKMVLLFGASKVEKKIGFYMGCGLMSHDEGNAITEMVDNLCEDLCKNDARDALDLCSAFGIPDHLIQAPIAFDWRKM